MEDSISVLDAIYTTRAIRKFKPEPVPVELMLNTDPQAGGACPVGAVGDAF